MKILAFVSISVLFVACSGNKEETNALESEFQKLNQSADSLIKITDQMEEELMRFDEAYKEQEKGFDKLSMEASAEARENYLKERRTMEDELNEKSSELSELQRAAYDIEQKLRSDK